MLNPSSSEKERAEESPWKIYPVGIGRHGSPENSSVKDIETQARRRDFAPPLPTTE